MQCAHREFAPERQAYTPVKLKVKNARGLPGNQFDSPASYRRMQAHQPEPAAKTHRGLGATVRTLMHMGSAGSAASADVGGGAKRGFRFSSLRDKLAAMVCVAKGADSATVAVTRVHALGALRDDEAALEAYTMPFPGGTPSAASSAGLTQHAAGVSEHASLRLSFSDDP